MDKPRGSTIPPGVVLLLLLFAWLVMTFGEAVGLAPPWRDLILGAAMFGLVLMGVGWFRDEGWNGSFRSLISDWGFLFVLAAGGALILVRALQ